MDSLLNSIPKYLFWLREGRCHHTLLISISISFFRIEITWAWSCDLIIEKKDVQNHSGHKGRLVDCPNCLSNNPPHPSSFEKWRIYYTMTKDAYLCIYSTELGNLGYKIFGTLKCQLWYTHIYYVGHAWFIRRDKVTT